MDQQPSEKRPRVLVVCHGNICRSPLAAGVLQRLLGLQSVRQGGFVNPGRRSPLKIREFSKRAGHNLEEHRSRLITLSDIEWAQVILYMDGGNRKRLNSFEASLDGKCKCLGEFIGKDRIADPNFIPRGVGLTNLLDSIVEASSNAAETLRQDT